jgi:broad specificity phosphatase PhoE/predicted nucleotidyltransferase
MNQFEDIKQNIKREILNVVSSKNYIISTTIVGSFASSPGIEGISDIDIVIIVEKLTQTIFKDINNSFQQIKSSQIGLDDFDIFINNTFGPLKFDNGKNIVFHLMIYDIEGHIDHVEQSPFTCYSWESFNPIQGISLGEVYPVLNLQLSDIIESRRGILSYIRDIDNGVITYRKYSFRKENPITLKEKFKLDLKHRLEYSYHITYNLLNNFYKIISREQSSLKDHEIISFYSNFETFPNHNIQFFKDLFLWKRKGSSSPMNEMDKIKLFINDFFSFAEIIKTSGKTISFRRHEITELNDGTFLGVNRDPSITRISKKISDFEYQIGYCSQLKRSKETLLGYYTTEIIESSLLNEIDYGLAEGLDIDQLNYKFPEITSSWEIGEDPKFPEGECQNDVLIRVREFLTKTLHLEKNCLVITHLVVLRMVMFYYLDLDFKNLYKITIEHLEGFDILSYKKFRSIEIENETRKLIRKQLSITND